MRTFSQATSAQASNRSPIGQSRGVSRNEAATRASIVDQQLSLEGRPLNAEVRALFEPRFGHDFSQVRAHTDSSAAASARAMNAVVETLSISPPNHGAEREANSAADAVMAGRPFRPMMRTGLAVHRQAVPALPATLTGLTATRVAFNNSGAPNANNCAENLPAGLGVDGPALGQNGMEMIFRINGVIPPGTEFEITRTVADGLWQQDGGTWTRLGGLSAGTSDDRHDQDECHTPVGGRIFVVDRPGLNGRLNPRGITIPGAGTVAATATAAVWKLSFAEWVLARNKGLGVGWQSISTPTFHRWHSILSVALVGGAWIRTDTPSGQPNEIELGRIGTTAATP